MSEMFQGLGIAFALISYIAFLLGLFGGLRCDVINCGLWQLGALLHGLFWTLVAIYARITKADK